MKRKINPYAKHFTKEELGELKKLKKRIASNLLRCAYTPDEQGGIPLCRKDQLNRSENSLERNLKATIPFFEKLKQYEPHVSREDFNNFFL